MTPVVLWMLKELEAFFPIRNLENDLTQPYVINFVRFQMAKYTIAFTLNHQTSILVKVKKETHSFCRIGLIWRDDLNNTTQQISDGSQWISFYWILVIDDRFYIIFIKPGDDSDIKSSKEVITNVDFSRTIQPDNWKFPTQKVMMWNWSIFSICQESLFTVKKCKETHGLHFQQTISVMVCI